MRQSSIFSTRFLGAFLTVTQLAGGLAYPAVPARDPVRAALRVNQETETGKGGLEETLRPSAAGLEEPAFVQFLADLKTDWNQLSDKEYGHRLEWIQSKLPAVVQSMLEAWGQALHPKAPRDRLLYAAALYLLEVPMGRIEQAEKEGDREKLQALDRQYEPLILDLREILRRRNLFYPEAPALSSPQLFVASLSADYRGAEKISKFVDLTHRLRYLPGEEKYFAVAWDLFCSGNHGKFAFEPEDLSALGPNAIFALNRLTDPSTLKVFPRRAQARIRIALKLGLLNTLVPVLSRRCTDEDGRFVAIDMRPTYSIRPMEELLAQVDSHSEKLLDWFDRFAKRNLEITRFWVGNGWVQYSDVYTRRLPILGHGATTVSLAELSLNPYSPRYRALIDELPFTHRSEPHVKQAIKKFGLRQSVQLAQPWKMVKDLASIQEAIDQIIAEFRENLRAAGAWKLDAGLEEGDALESGRLQRLRREQGSLDPSA